MNDSTRKAMFSSEKQDWGTPQAYIDYLQELYNMTIDLDVCAHHDNNKAPRYFSLLDSCFDNDWDSKNAFMNPPFGRAIGKFIDKAIEQVDNGNCQRLFILVPARTDTKWAHRLFTSLSCTSITFYKGRFNFDYTRNTGAKNAPFPSMMIVLEHGPPCIRMTRFVDIAPKHRGF